MLDGLKRHAVMLDELSVTQLRVLGDGNLSNGIRRAARVAFGRYQATPDSDTGSGPIDAPGARQAPRRP